MIVSFVIKVIGISSMYSFSYTWEFVVLDWTTLSYIGNQSFMDGVPMGRVYSVSDGTVENSTGVPYIMASPMDLTFQDVTVNILIYLEIILLFQKNIINSKYK